jgi:uroporphyrinogen III methyltransferase/synthase
MTGKVYLVGAGPGDPGLLTLRGRRCLAAADVIVYDYLANPELLRFAKLGAERVFCGKHGGSIRLLSQEEINRLLVDRARAGKVVVRLKGGDPFIFGRGGEEAQELVAAGIPFEVVPGITSATAVPAYAGIPLTHREVTSTVTFVAGHTAAPGGGGAEVPWSHLAHGGTLVLLMSTTQVADNLGRLRAAGLPPATPAALIRWGTMPAQETIVGTVGDLAERVAARRLRPPTVVVIGEVVRLRDQVRWFEERPLFGRSIVVTRASHQAAAFIDELEALGAGVVHVPCIEVVPPPSLGDLDAALARLEAYDWIVFTSVNGVQAFLDRLATSAGDIRRLGHVRLAAIGPETGRALARAHLHADVVPGEFRAEVLASALGRDAVGGRRVLLPRAATARAVLPELLRRAGAVVDDVAAYDVRVPATDATAIRRRLSERTVDLLTFASSTTVRHFVDLVGADAVREAVAETQPGGRRRVRVACIGPVTAETALALGMPVDIQPRQYTIAALTEAIVGHFCNGG